jgi:hypothetical protein
MHYQKDDLVERLGEPAEENARPNLSDPGKPLNVLRWDCGCGATKLYDDTLWEWDPCDRHKSK